MKKEPFYNEIEKQVMKRKMTAQKKILDLLEQKRIRDEFE